MRNTLYWVDVTPQSRVLRCRARWRQSEVRIMFSRTSSSRLENGLCCRISCFKVVMLNPGLNDVKLRHSSREAADLTVGPRRISMLSSTSPDPGGRTWRRPQKQRGDSPEKPVCGRWAIRGTAQRTCLSLMNAQDRYSLQQTSCSRRRISRASEDQPGPSCCITATDNFSREFVAHFAETQISGHSRIDPTDSCGCAGLGTTNNS